MKSNPPRLAVWLTHRAAQNADIEDILGDLEETYLNKQKEDGKLRADIFYWKNAVSLLFSYALRKRKHQAGYSPYYSGSGAGLIRNYLKVAVRNMAKQKLFTSINLLGLAMGMSFNLLILAILSQVFLFDEFHEKKDRIYRIVTHVTTEEGVRSFATTFPDLQTEMKDGQSGIQSLVKVSTGELSLMKFGNEVPLAAAITSPPFFDIFSFDLELGSKITCLQNPNSIVLSRKTADLMFPGINPIDALVETSDGTLYKVTGVLADHPRQTHLSFDLIVSESPVSRKPWNDFGNEYVYLLLNEGVTSTQLQPALASSSQKASQFQPGSSFSFELQPLSHISPGRDLWRDNTPFDWITCVLLFALGLLILIPAAFNYSNLMIARALKRAKEIGIRKIVGSHKREITRQFLVESFVLTIIALTGSIIIFTIIRSEFLGMIRGAETLDLSLNPVMLGWFILFAAVTAFLVGIFPATYFSKISPLNSLKGVGKSSTGSISNIRKILMVVQFSLSLGFVLGVVVISWQYKYLINSEMGFRKDNILVVPLSGQNADLLSHEFGSFPEVTAISQSGSVPGVEGGKLTRLLVDETSTDSLQAYELIGSENLVDFLDLKVMQENFTPGNQAATVWINETLLHELEGFTNGKTPDEVILADGKKYTIAGVIRDFNFHPMNERIQPLIIRTDKHLTHYLLLSIQTGDVIGLIQQLDQKWTSLDQKVPFEPFFLDQQMEESYQSVISMIKMFSFLGFLSITISCIGILGMVVYMTENRTKELAIRKTMGASLTDLYYVLGGSFMKLLLIATVITTPLAYLFYDRIFVRMINQYSTGVGISELLIGVVTMLVLASLPLLWMVGKISRVNPAESLRYE